MLNRNNSRNQAQIKNSGHLKLQFKTYCEKIILKELAVGRVFELENY